MRRQAILFSRLMGLWNQAYLLHVAQPKLSCLAKRALPNSFFEFIITVSGLVTAFTC